MSLSPSISAWCLALLMAFASGVSLAQEESDSPAGDDTPELVPQQESLQIEPYTGPLIKLPEPDAPPPATRVETKTITDYYDAETKEHPRVTRGVVRFSDDSIKNDGEYIEFYEDGTEFSHGSYQNGVPVGEWVYQHPDGSVAKKVNYKDGYPDGKIEVHREDGTLKAIRVFKEGKRDSNWVLYDETGKQPLVESSYDAGTPVGVWQIYFPSGQKRRQIPFVDGKQHGTVVEWNEDGEKLAEVTFENGIQHGISRLWTKDGRMFEQEYEQGRLVSMKEIEQ